MSESGQRITSLPVKAAPPAVANKPNPARDVQAFVGEKMAMISAPVDALNLGLAKATLAFVQMLPKFPAARLFGDIVFGWPHAHSHPPNLIPPAPPIPLPSVGPVICAGAVSVLINGLPSARVGDLGFGVWCGGFFPIFEIQTGSSHVFIGGARPARMLIDFTRHCMPGSPGFSKLGAAMMVFSAGMGALGVASSLIDKGHAEAAAEEAPTAEEAMAASAQAAALGLGAAIGAAQTAADLAAAALGMMMGKDPAIPPGIPIGNFITGSPNVLIGGFPMPGWMMVLKGLGKLLKGVTRGVQRCLPKGSRLRNALCAVTGHPVDIASGRVFTSQTDFELFARIPIEFTRAYDTSAVDYLGSLGPGWIHRYDIHLWEDEEQGLVILRNEEARLVGFEPVDIGDKSFNPLEKLWLERLEDQIYVVYGADGARHKFAPVYEPGREEAGKSEAHALRLTEIADRNGNRITLTYQQGRLSQMDDSAGRRLSFVYITLDNGAVRLAGIDLALDGRFPRNSRVVNYSYDTAGHLINATDRGFAPWRYAYDGDLLIRETNRNGLSFHFEYVGAGTEARCVHTWGDNGIHERWLVYDNVARSTVVTNSLKDQTTYHFNELDLPTRITDPSGGVQRFDYGPNGELLSESDENGRVTTYEYNHLADCVRVINPDGTKREFSYTVESLPLSRVDESGARFLQEYDDRGNIVATIDALGNRNEYSYTRFGDIAAITDPLGAVTRFNWSDRGWLMKRATPSGAVTVYGYDERGRLVMTTDPTGRSTHYAYDALDRLIRREMPGGGKHHFEYDPEGNLTSFRDARGRQTRFRYQGHNKLAERSDASGHRRRFIYDSEERVIEARNERDEAYRFIYDPQGRITKEVGFDGCQWEYQYDLSGLRSGIIDPAGRVTRFARDRRGRITERHRPDGTTIGFRYDPVGRLIAATTPESEVGFAYNALGMVVSESQNGKVIEHEYDQLGRRVKRHSPAGNTVEFNYDIDSRLDSVSTPRGAMSNKYDAAGRLTARRLPGQLEETWQYNARGLAQEQSLRSPRNQQLVSRGYKHDAEGNVVEISDHRRRISRFTYDPVERLREVVQPDTGLEQFVYDPAGDLLQRGNREFQYGAPGRLTQTDGVRLIYDASGNLIEKRRGGSTIRYSYDTDNRLIAIETPEGGRIEFVYDAFGRRIAKKSKEGEVGFLWDGEVLLAEQHEYRLAEYVFDPDSETPWLRFSHESLVAYHTDHLGTPRELTDERGRIVWSADYDVYGRINTLHAADTDNQLRFPGQYEDRETGLYYNFHRYYDPDLGRYLTQDPIGVIGGLAPYQYTRNPVNWTDPLGLLDEWEIARMGSTSHRGDGRDAHELLQAAWLEHNVSGYEGRNKGMGRDNPAMAVSPANHDRISDAQRVAGLHDPATLRGQTALQNINANAKILEAEMIRAGVPPAEAKMKIKEMKKEARAFGKKYSIPGC
jgi:RHS repeat-associated protein